MDKPNNLAYLTSIFELGGSWHPTLRPSRFWYFEEIKGPLTSRSGVDIPRLKVAVLSLK
jgi:hypothetical protein